MHSEVCHRAYWIYCYNCVDDPQLLITILANDFRSVQLARQCVSILIRDSIEYTREFKECISKATGDGRVKSPRYYCWKKLKQKAYLGEIPLVLDCDSFYSYLLAQGFRVKPPRCMKKSGNDGGAPG